MLNVMIDKKFSSLFFIFAFVLIIVFFSCRDDHQKNTSQVDPPVELEIRFTNGENFKYTKAYVIWVENEKNGFIQNLFVCKKVHDYKLTGTPLPYWEMNKRTISEKAEVDAVSGATQKHTDFSVRAPLKEKQTFFTLFFEIDHSFDKNDWFPADQPAILYSVDIDLSNPVNEYTLEFVGWTPNEKTENIIASTPAGTLQKETRYITQLKTPSGDFGVWDDRAATDMVDSIVVRIIR